MFLAHRHTGKIRLTTVVLCLTIFALFTSTTIYTVTSIIFYLSNLLNAFVSSGGRNTTSTKPGDSENGNLKEGSGEMEGNLAVCAAGPEVMSREAKNAVARLALSRRVKHASIACHTEVYSL